MRGSGGSCPQAGASGDEAAAARFDFFAPVAGGAAGGWRFVGVFLGAARCTWQTGVRAGRECGGVLRVRVCLECVWGRRVVYAVHLCGRTRLECDEWYDVAQCLAHTLKRGRRGPPGVGTASAPKYKRARDPRERWARFRGGRVLECRRTERLAERASRHSLTGDCWRGIWNRCGDGCVSSLIASDESARRVLSAAAVRKP